MICFKITGSSGSSMTVFDTRGGLSHPVTRQTVETIKDHGPGFCTLTKGAGRELRDLDLFRPDRDAFASTLTSLDESFSLKWERGASLPADRLATLKRSHDAGIFTWLSLEPVLDTAAALEIIRQIHRYVDLFKVGRANYVGLTKAMDWKQFTADVLEVLTQPGARHYIKKDLQPYLPAAIQIQCGFLNTIRLFKEE